MCVWRFPLFFNEIFPHCRFELIFVFSPTSSPPLCFPLILFFVPFKWIPFFKYFCSPTARIIIILNMYFVGRLNKIYESVSCSLGPECDRSFECLNEHKWMSACCRIIFNLLALCFLVCSLLCANKKNKKTKMRKKTFAHFAKFSIMRQFIKFNYFDDIKNPTHMQISFTTFAHFHWLHLAVQ